MRTISIPSTRFDVSKTAFNAKIKEAIKEKFGVLDKTHAEYFERELKLLEAAPDEWLAHFLIVSDFVTAIKTKHPGCFSEGRGAIVSSFVSYLLDITGIDPVEYNLTPERFYVSIKTNPIPAIDLDIASSCKDDAIKYLQNYYGVDNVIVPSVKSKSGNVGVHACALFLTKEPYYNYLELNYSVKQTHLCPVVDATHEELETLGFLRINLIASKFQDRIFEMSKKNTDFSLADIKSYGRTMSVCNLKDGLFGDTFAANFYSFKSFNDILIYLSVMRRPQAVFTSFLKNNFDKDSYKDPVIDKILEETKGHILYQEQANDILCYVLDCDYYNANATRKDITKKNTKAMRYTFAHFVKNLTDKEINPDMIIRLWNEICESSTVTILKSHAVAVAYGIVHSAYLTENTTKMD